MFSVTFIGTMWNNDNFSWGHLQFFRISLFPHYHKRLWVKLNHTKLQCCLGFARYAGTAIHIQDQLLQISISKSKQLSKFHRKNWGGMCNSHMVRKQASTYPASSSKRSFNNALLLTPNSMSSKSGRSDSHSSKRLKEGQSKADKPEMLLKDPAKRITRV